MVNDVDVRYLNRDFASIQDQLINFAEAYYPNTVQDFSEGSVGLMYIDMASYVGDVLSFYTDVQFKESFIQFAEEQKNVVALANELGYRPNVTNPATTEIDVFAAVPTTTDEDGNTVPDFRFVPIIEENMIIGSSSEPGVQFRTLEDVNLEVDTPSSPLDVKILEKDEETGQPISYLLTKRVTAAAGTIETTTFEFDEPEPYPSRTINDENVIEVLNVVDSQGNEWKQVPYLAQDRVFEEYRNTTSVDETLSEFREEAPFLLNVERSSKRFIVRTRNDQQTTIQFGSGVSEEPDSALVPNPLSAGNPEIEDIRQVNLSLDPTNFLSTDSYGEVPFETTLEVEYVSGGGVESNVPINDLTEIVDINFNLEDVDVGSDENQEILSQIQDSIRVTNPVPATGGGPGESTEEIRQNAQAFFAAQNRAVTKEDYVTRVLSMPSRYGSVAKAVAEEANVGLGVNLRVLGWNDQRQLVQVNDAIKENIKNFLSRYRMVTDGINILDGYVINIGVEADVTPVRSSTRREVKVAVIEMLEEKLSPKNRDFNQPIVKGELISELNTLDSVQNVRNLGFENKINTDEGYAGNEYDLKFAERQGVIYPSKDPSVFTVRFPNKDIKVRT
jgi:hypothetical protein